MPSVPEHSSTIASAPKLAIVGMDMALGSQAGTGIFEQAVFRGKSLLPGDPAKPVTLTQATLEFWRLDSAQVINLREEDRLLLQVISNLLRQPAAISHATKTTLIYARGGILAAAVAQRLAKPTTLAAGPVFADEIAMAALERFPGQVVDLSMEGNFTAAALREALAILSTGKSTQVILAASVVPAEFVISPADAGIKTNTGPFTFGIDRSVDGWTVGSGSVGLLLARAADAPMALAIVEGCGSASRDLASPKKTLVPTFVSSETVSKSVQLACEKAHLRPDSVGYLEILAAGFPPVDSAEIGGLIQAYSAQSTALTCAIGSIQANGGYLFAASGLAGLARAALCLHDRIIPAVPGWTGPKKPELWAQSPFYIAEDQRTWFLPAGLEKRTAAVNTIGWDGSCTHIFLSENAPQLERANLARTNAAFYLIPIAGTNRAEITAALNSARTALLAATDAGSFAAATFSQYSLSANSALTVSIVGQSLAEIQKELDLAIRDVPATFESNKNWQTPLGSCFSPNPVGREGGIAFVFPGGFNSYLGLGRDLFHLYPEIYPSTLQLVSDLGATLEERMLYPRSLEALDKNQRTELESQLNSDPIAMITSGSIISVLFTKILRDVYQIRPSAAFGYSLGEIGMLFASGIWEDANRVSSKLNASPLFHQRISGPLNAVRDHWGLPQTAQATPEPIWANYFLMTPVENALRALETEDKVFLTHINTPRQVVIGGDPTACQRVIAALKCTSLRAPFDFALHCAAMKSEYPELTSLLSWPVVQEPSEKLYSAAELQPLPIERKAIAENIAHMLCTPINFPALVRQVYSNGTKVFIELGANANCSKWIEDTLKTEPVLSVAINRKGMDDHTAIVRLLAKLAAHNVPMNLAPLYQ